MGSRRQGRECALQLLYQCDAKGGGELPQRIFDELKVQGEAREFAMHLFYGVCEHRVEFDALLEESSAHWRVSRMPTVDKNILRMALFELLYCDDIPMKVTINEAVEVAKRYGTSESGPFVNGVLDAIAKRYEEKREGE